MGELPKELLSLAYDHDIRMTEELNCVSFYIEDIFADEPELGSTTLGAMVDVGLTSNSLLKNTWFETHRLGYVSELNLYTITNSMRQMLLDKAEQHIELALSST